MSFPFVDLFAGIGGFHAVLSALGGHGVLAAEIDAAPASIYEKNWGLKPEADVVQLAMQAHRVKDHTVLAGGFPCQPFSKSGRQLGMGEQRGQLFHEVLKILEAKRPPLVVLENVRNIAGPRQRSVWSAVVEGLRDAGYRTPSEPCVFSPHLLPPERGGAPQIRERVYILGTYVGRSRARRETNLETAVPNRPVDGWNPQEWDLERDLLIDERRIVDPGRYRITGEERLWIEVWNDFLERLGSAHLPGFPLWSEYWRDDAKVDPEAPAWKRDLETKNLNFYKLHRRVIRAWKAANPQLQYFPASRQKLEWQAQDQARNLYACLLQFRPSGIRVKKPTYTPALVAMTQTAIVGHRDRRIVPAEAARLQGFPDWFDFGDQSDALTYKQLGNAINVGAAYHVIRTHVVRDQKDLSVAGGEALVTAVEAAADVPLLPGAAEDLRLLA